MPKNKADLLQGTLDMLILKSLSLGDPREGKAILGSVVDRGAADRVVSLVLDAITKGAKLANRLRCCLDKWWLPPLMAPASCPNGCDARVDCSL